MKRVAGVTAMLLAFCILAGCSKFDSSRQADKIVLEAIGVRSDVSADWQEMDFFKKMEELTNIRLDIKTYSNAEYKDKIKLIFATNDLPDMFLKSGLSKQDEVYYGDECGYLLPIEDLISKYAPNLKSKIEENENIRKAITLPNGHIYSTPSVNNLPRDLTNKIWINNEWLSQLGLSMPKTTDEFYDVLKAFKENDPNGNGLNDEIPLSLMKGSQFHLIFGSWGLICNMDYMCVDENGKVLFVPIQDGYKEALKFYHKLYSEGLLDNDSFTQTRQNLEVKGNSADPVLGSFAMSGPYPIVGVERNDKYSAMPPLYGSSGKKPLWNKFESISSGAFVMTSNNKYPEETIKWVDILYTDEMSDYLTRGEKDVHYVDEADGKWDFIYGEQDKNPLKFGGAFSPVFGGATGFPYINNEEIILLMKDEEPGGLNGYINEQTKVYDPYLRISYPSTYFTGDIAETLSGISININSYVEKMMVRFIMGNEDIDGYWDEYVSELKKMQVDTLTDIYQKNYDEYLAR